MIIMGGVAGGGDEFASGNNELRYWKVDNFADWQWKRNTVNWEIATSSRLKQLKFINSQR